MFAGETQMNRALRFRPRLAVAGVQKSVDVQKFQETVHHFGLYRLAVNHAAPPAAFIVKTRRRYS